MFLNPVIPTQNFLQFRNLDGYFWHPTSRAYCQSRILPRFCFKIPNPELQIREIQDPETSFGAWGSGRKNSCRLKKKGLQKYTDSSKLPFLWKTMASYAKQSTQVTRPTLQTSLISSRCTRREVVLLSSVTRAASKIVKLCKYRACVVVPWVAPCKVIRNPEYFS